LEINKFVDIFIAFNKTEMNKWNISIFKAKKNSLILMPPKINTVSIDKMWEYFSDNLYVADIVRLRDDLFKSKNSNSTYNLK